MDTASLVSIVPCTIREQKPLLPAEFYLDKGSVEKPFILHIGKGISDIYVGEGRGQMGPNRSVVRVPVDADVIANAVVVDWMEAQYGIILPDAVPGFFWVPGHVAVKDVTAEIKVAEVKQLNWFKQLVHIADDDWNKYRQHKTISDIQRYSCNFLKLERPWLVDNEIVLAMSECPACFEKVHPRAVICSHCQHILDAERHKKMAFATA
jgi:hypothetical protein